ncbi:MAG: SMP-30/gluconolactonase/LRE family protein [Silvibacterium sp.]|nr:SMP-30/gluconolactonase/LRE family protein [Silvibacterium sp.]
MPTGVTVSRHNRVFVNFPRWGDDVPFTVAELVNGKAVAYPNAEINRQDNADAARHFISVQSVVVDPKDRLWVLDTGAPMMKEPIPSGPKLVCIDLATNTVVQTILFPPEIAGPTAYLNDVRFDLRYGKAGFAYITDSSEKGPNGIVVVDLASGESWRRLSDDPSTRPAADFMAIVEGRPVYRKVPGLPGRPFLSGSDGIAISADGSVLYYCPLSSRVLYAVNTDTLRDATPRDQAIATVRIFAGKGASDGLESDTAGNVFAGDYESDSIDIIRPDGSLEVLVHDPRLLWPDTMSLADDGYLYVTANQLTRQPSLNDGKDLRQKPYVLFRIKTQSTPVRLQ